MKKSVNRRLFPRFPLSRGKRLIARMGNIGPVESGLRHFHLWGQLLHTFLYAHCAKSFTVHSGGKINPQKFFEQVGFRT